MRTPDGSPTARRTPAEAIAAAQHALARLRTSEDAGRSGAPPRAFVVAGYLVAVLAVAGLVVHTFFEGGLQVTETSVLLLALALLAPFTSRLKAIEFGGAKAEWRDDAAAGLASTLEVLEAQHAAIAVLLASIDELSERGDRSGATGHQPAPGPGALSPQALGEPHRGPHLAPPSPPPVPAPPALPAPPNPPTPAAPRTPPREPVHRVLWVDDDPASNVYELEALRRLVQVDQATSTTQALELLTTGRYGLVISDAVRGERGAVDVHAGRELLRASHDLAGGVPVIVYAGEDTRTLQGAELLAEGAADVVTTHVELLTAVRRVTREVFEAAVRTRAGALLVDPPPTDRPVDAVVDVPGTGLVGLELANWLRQPRPDAVLERASRLDPLVRDGIVRAGWVVAPLPALTAEVTALVPVGVELLTFEEFARRVERP